MMEQGIENILVYCDEDGEGQIVSLMNSFKLVGYDDTWHLQDDIIISSRFKELTEEYNKGIVCGFCNSFSNGTPGYLTLPHMWYSMPCIRIPGDIFAHFINWMHQADTQRRFQAFFAEKKHDDMFLQYFLKENYPNIRIRNLKPNVVNHIDHLIGGSIINGGRTKSPEYLMATYWDEPELLADIKKKLERGGKRK
jgi:hypothetical protein